LTSSLVDPLSSLNKHFEELSGDQKRWLEKCKEQTHHLSLLKDQAPELEELFNLVPDYLSKIFNIRKDMVTMGQRLSELKERTSVLKEKKMIHLRKERQLMAKPSPSLSKQNNNTQSQ